MRRQSRHFGGSTALCRCVLFLALACCTSAAHAWRGTVAEREVEVGGYLETRQVFRTNRSTEHELNLQRLHLESRAWIEEWLSLEVAASLQNGGPATRSTRSGFYDIDNVFQSVSPAVEIEEAFLRIGLDRFGARIGQLKHSWGKLDRFQPNDVINPERFADPVLIEEGERKIGVPSVELSYNLPEREWLPEEGVFSFVVVPRYIPFRLPQPGERWFPPNAVPAEFFKLPEEVYGSDRSVPLSLEVRNSSVPSFSPDNASVGARLAAHTRGVDYGLYYYRGHQTDPVFELGAEARAVSMDQGGIAGVTLLSPVFQRIHLFGADLAFTLGRFGFRAEVALTKDKPFNRDLLSLLDSPERLEPGLSEAIAAVVQGASAAAVDLGQTFAVSDALQWGIGFDTKVFDFDVLFELSQTDVLENTDKLLVEDTETVLLGDIRRRFLRDDLSLQLVSMYGASSDYTLLLPRLTYRVWDRVELRLGYAFLSGRSRSRLGQYKGNDQAYIRLRLYL